MSHLLTCLSQGLKQHLAALMCYLSRGGRWPQKKQSWDSGKHQQVLTCCEEHTIHSEGLLSPSTRCRSRTGYTTPRAPG